MQKKPTEEKASDEIEVMTEGKIQRKKNSRGGMNETCFCRLGPPVALTLCPLDRTHTQFGLYMND